MKVDKYNRNADKAIDPKKDPTPSPNYYNLIAQWANIKSKKGGDDNIKKNVNYLNAISRGPTINCYYAKDI